MARRRAGESPRNWARAQCPALRFRPTFHPRPANAGQPKGMVQMQAYTGELVQAAYIEHRGGLLRHLTLVARDGEVAQDLTHETFIRLAHEIEAGRTPDDTGAWLHSVGRNLATSRGRHLQVAQRRSASLPLPAEPQRPDD